MLFNEGYPYFERCKHRGIFEANNASSDNDDFPWEMGELG